MGELIRKLMPSPVVVAPGLPSTAQVTALERAHGDHSDVVVHILYYPLTRRAPDIDIIEEPGLLEDVRLRVRFPERPRRVALVPQNQSLPFEHQDGYAACRVPRVVGHQAIIFE